MSANQMIPESIAREARLLAQDNRQVEPEILKTLWFPDAEEVRLIHVHENVPLSQEGRVTPVYFPASPADDLPAPSGIALIRADEEGRLELPPGWGQWSDAQVLYRRED